VNVGAKEAADAGNAIDHGGRPFLFVARSPKLNRNYFDPKLPRSAVQLMVVEVGCQNLDQAAARNVDSFDSTLVTQAFVKKVDWKVIAERALR
jgi:hypothetical protein